MKLNKNLGMILLSVWLFVGGLKFLFAVSVPSVVLWTLALVTGVVILLIDESLRVRMNKDIGMILLSIWLVVPALKGLLGVSVPRFEGIWSILALVTGVVLVLLDQRLRVRVNKSLGVVLLGIFLVYHGLVTLFAVSGGAFAYIWSILALVTGAVILLFDRRTA
jgi:hypothetical protein